MQYYIYIISNSRKTVIYIGVTSNLVKRIHQHKYNLIDGFSKKFNVDQLVYYEVHESIEEAILREKRIKKWKRAWKENFINKSNHEWIDLYQSLLD